MKRDIDHRRDAEYLAAILEHEDVPGDVRDFITDVIFEMAGKINLHTPEVLRVAWPLIMAQYEHTDATITFPFFMAIAALAGEDWNAVLDEINKSVRGKDSQMFPVVAARDDVWPELLAEGGRVMKQKTKGAPAALPGSNVLAFAAPHVRGGGAAAGARVIPCRWPERMPEPPKPESAEAVGENFDLLKFVAPHPAHTYLIWAKGDNADIGVYDGDMLIIDTYLRAAAGDLVVEEDQGELFVRRLDGRNCLRLAGQPAVSVFGVIIHVLRTFTEAQRRQAKGGDNAKKG
jgi:hypothetical protein